MEEARSGRGDRVEEVLGQDIAIDGGSLYDKMFVFQVVRDGPSQTSPDIWRLLPSGQREKQNRKEEAYPMEVKEWFFREYRKEKREITVHIFSELKKGGTLFRAHPNYQGNGPWFDYAMVSYQIEEEERWEEYPARLAAFFYEVDSKKGEIIRDEEDPKDDGWRVLVQQCEYQTPEQKEEESMIMEHWTLQSTAKKDKGEIWAKFQQLTTAALNGRLYCVEADPVGNVFSKPVTSNFDILIIRDMRTEWHKKFLGIE
jgi:hypothetical protein